MEKNGLTIVIDRAGTGKSAYILDQIKKNGVYREQLLLVPDHASHQAERDLCAFCGDAVSRYASVSSFHWLAAAILSLVGGTKDPVLDSGGKILTMYRALQKQAKELKVYHRPSQKAAFLEQLVSLEDEMRTYCVDVTELDRYSEKVSRPLQEKLQDLSSIFTVYERMLKEGGVDRRDLLERVLDVLDADETSCYFSGKDIYVDGFMYFNQREEEILTRMMKHANSVTITLLGDKNLHTGIFKTAFDVQKRLEKAAQCAHAPCRVIASPKRDTDSLDMALRHMEQASFGDLHMVYEKETDAVALMQARTAYDEVEAVASEIRKLVAQKHCRYRDILIMAPNMSDYEATIENVFERYEIPVFLNRSRDVLEKPAITLVIAALDILANGWEYEDVFRYLKTGMSGISLQRCDELENYVLKWDIRGSMWTREGDWTAHPDGYDAESTARSEQMLKRLNETRNCVRKPLLKLAESMKKEKTARGKIMALYAFLVDVKLAEQLKKKAVYFRETDGCDKKLADEYVQLWKILCGAMEQFSWILEDDELTEADFVRLLKLLLTQYDIGTIPAALDQVSVSDMSRNDRHTRGYLFLLGVNDHVLPGQGAAGSVLTENDRLELWNAEMRLAPFGVDHMDMEMLQLYAAFAQATKRVTISWAMTDVSGAELRPAFIVKRLQEMYPNVPVHKSGRERLLTAPLPALEEAGKQGSGPLWNHFAGKDVYKNRLTMMERARTMERGKLSPAVVKSLYGEQIRMSASRMDTIKSCHFAFFMQYGLKVKERRKAGLDAPEIGTFLHYLLENTAKEVKQRGGFGAVSEEERNQIIERYIDRFAEESLGGLRDKSARFRYLFRRLKKTAYAIVHNVANELAVSDFEPYAFELEFSEESKMKAVKIEAANTTLSVGGKVDRVDGWLKDGKLYLRVVDYKTGKKKFDLAEILHGVGVQMLLYLFTLERHGMEALGGEGIEEIVPAGVEYIPARDVILSMDRNASEEEIARAMQKELKRSGMFLYHADVLEAMEHGCTQSPCFLPLSIKKKKVKTDEGETETTEIVDGVATAAQLGKLSQYVDHLLEEIAKELAEGNIDADPNYQGESKNACMYCAFASACHFEEGRGHDRREYIASVKADEFWNKISKLSASETKEKEEV